MALLALYSTLPVCHSDSGPQQVQSTEAPMRQDSSEFTYNVQDARAYANRTASHSVQYTQDLPALSSAEILNPYRGGSPYGYGTKQFYPAMSSYSTGYPEEYADYGISCPSQQTVLNHEAVGMIPYPWLSRSKQPAASSVYLDPDATYAYGGTASLVHRSAHAVTTDSPNFSFSHMAAQLPAASVHGTDRLLPTPVSRSLSSSSGLPYPSLQSLKAAIPTTGPQSPPLSATGGPGDVASAAAAAGYSNGFDTSGLPYSSAMALPTHHHHHTPHNHIQHHPARTGSVPSSSYSTAAESLFSEHDHGLRSHGSTVVDLTGYAYADSGVGQGASSLRRGSRSSSQTSSGTGTGSSLRSSQTGYVQTENQQQQQQQQTDEPVAAHVHPHQHQQHQNGLQHHHQIQQPQQQQQHSNQQQQQQHHHHHNIAAVVAGSTAPTTTYLPDTPGASGLGSGHAENRRTAVGARR